MKLIDERVYTGRNIYSHKPCMRITIDIENEADKPTKDIENFNDRLVDAFPGLINHKCSLGFTGGFCKGLRKVLIFPMYLNMF